MSLEVRVGIAADAAELAEVAAATFPMACPPEAGAEDIAAFIAENLSAANFTEYLADPQRRLLVLRDGDRILGYAMTIQPPDDPEIELSKFYVLAERHGSGASATLMRAVIESTNGSGATALRLGVNRRNERAQTFYRKQGFEITGTRTFNLGWSTEQDYVMTRALS